MSMGPTLVKGEVEGVISFVIARGREKQERTFYVSMTELTPFLTGAKKESDILNRVRWRMAKELEDAGIRFTFDGRGYTFIMDENVDLAFSGEISVPQAIIDKKQNQQNQQTDWGIDFIPPHYFGRLVERCNAGENIVLTGPKGCGKSYTAEEVFRKLNIPFKRFAIGQLRDPIDLIGTKELVEINGVTVTKFVNGLITDALQYGMGVIIDEVDSVSPDVMRTFNMILETGTNLTVLTETGEETIYRHPNFRIIATANTRGYGDDTGNYAGTKIQNSATWDRLTFERDCDYDSVIEKQLVKPFLPEAVIHALYAKGEKEPEGIILKIRRAIKEGTLDDTMSFRPILWFAKRYNTMGWHEGMYYFRNKFRDENKETISKIITDHLGFEFIPSDNNYSKTEPNFINNFKETLREKGFIQ